MFGNTVTPDEAQRITGIYSHALISRCARVLPSVGSHPKGTSPQDYVALLRSLPLVRAKIRGPG